MADTENPDHEDWSPETDPQPPIPAPELHNQGILCKANSHCPEKDEEPAESRIREWAQVAINLILAIVGIFAVCYYSGQLEVMKGQLTEIVRQFPEIQAQRIATQGQLAQQQDAFKITERAWVSVAGTGFDYHKDDAGVSRARGTIVLINTGPTPAFGPFEWTCFQVRTSEPFVGETAPIGPPCKAQPLGILGTNVTEKFTRIDPNRIVPANSLPQNDDVIGPRLFVWGRITYFTFAKDGPHFTSFCLKSSGPQLGPCIHGNEAN